MAVDYGLDLSCVADLDENGAEVDGITLLAQALLRRLITPRGALIDDPTYGYDLSAVIDEASTPRQQAMIASAIDGELRKDERVLRAVTTLVLSRDLASSYKATATVVITPSAGPTFKLVLGVSSVTVDLLTVTR